MALQERTFLDGRLDTRNPLVVALGQHQMVPSWGRCTTHFRLCFSGDWDVHWGVTRILTHGLVSTKGHQSRRQRHAAHMEPDKRPRSEKIEETSLRHVSRLALSECPDVPPKWTKENPANFDPSCPLPSAEASPEPVCGLQKPGDPSSPKGEPLFGVPYFKGQGT